MGHRISILYHYWYSIGSGVFAKTCSGPAGDTCPRGVASATQMPQTPGFRAESTGESPLGLFNPIGARPPQAAERSEPGHFEGDLILGSFNRSAIVTLFDRASRMCLLADLPEGHTARSVLAALVETFDRSVCQHKLTLTWDRGVEMAEWDHLESLVGISVGPLSVFFLRRTHRGNGPPTRTGTACCAATSARAPTSACTANRPSSDRNSAQHHAPPHPQLAHRPGHPHWPRRDDRLNSPSPRPATTRRRADHYPHQGQESRYSAAAESRRLQPSRAMAKGPGGALDHQLGNMIDQPCPMYCHTPEPVAWFHATTAPPGNPNVDVNNDPDVFVVPESESDPPPYQYRTVASPVPARDVIRSVASRVYVTVAAGLAFDVDTCRFATS